MTPDWLLLRRYAREDSQDAFATLTARYLNLVYSVCLREVHDPELAQDVTQAVFLLLARTAPSFRSKTALPGWLFRTARFAAQNARTREERRRRTEEKAAQAMQQTEENEDAAWSEIEPLLNQSLALLKPIERECVLLRFFQGLSFAEAGEALNLSEEAARKRVTRALEKMRHFFGKNGVIVPGTALAVLLSVRAAKAAPAHLSGAAAHILAGSVPGPVSLITEGAFHAMKIAQIKIAVGVTAVVALGFSTFAIACGVSTPFSMAYKFQSLAALPKPGHILAQSPAKSLTAAQIASDCREAYAALSSYQGTSTVTTQSVSSNFPMVLESHTSASIQFVSPGKIHVEGTAEHGGGAFAYISNGSETEETYLGSNNWKRMNTTESAVAGVTGIALRAATTIPAMLLKIKWGDPLAVGKSLDPEVREDTEGGQPCYVLTTHSVTPTRSETAYLWVGEKSLLLRRLVTEEQSLAQTKEAAGTPIDMPAMQMHSDERFMNDHINEVIPESAFALPTAQ